MPSSNNLIQSLRSAHDPHFKLEGRVGGLEKGLGIQVAQLHKTLSKSFAMQRKTLVRVLGLEKRVAELEAAKAAVQEAEEAIEEAAEELGVEDEIPEGLDDILDDVRGEKEVGATATKTKQKTKKKPKIKAKKKPKKKPKIKAKKRKIKGKDLGFKSRVMGTDDKGGYLSGAERKKQFLQGKLATTENKFNSADIGEDDGKRDRVVQFLNVDVKDKLEEINDGLVEIKGVVTTQGDLADDRDESLRQSILSDKKKQRENKLEKKEKSVGDKMIENVTKPVGNFLNKLVKFVMMTFVGSVVNRVLTLLKDPAQLLDPIKRFFNLVIGLVNSVMKGLWNVTGAPMNFIVGGINKGVSSLLDAINKATGLLKIPAIPAPQIPLIPGPPEFEYIPLSKTAQAKNEGVAMAGGGLVPGYENGGVVTDPEEKARIEAETLFWVNKERTEFLGLPPLDKITYADGVELTKAMGPEYYGKGITETSDTQSNFDTMTKSTWQTKSRGAETIFQGSVGQLTEEDKQSYLDSNPQARLAQALHQQIEMDNLGADISASAKPKKFNMGGKVPGSGTGDTVPAMLTPGEFVISKGAVDQIGVDKLMAMNAAGGGTNVPKLMKFAGGGMVPGIDAPSGRGRNVVVVGGGGKKSSSSVSSTGAGQEVPRFSSTDPNNMTIPVIKSVYNLMS